MRPLLYLTLRRFINSLRRVPGSPRLLFPFLFLVFVLVLFTGAFLWAGSLQGERSSPTWGPREFVEGGPGALIGAVRGVLLFSLFGAVVAAFGEGSMFFSQSDVDFLFPAPLSRRAVLLFKMLGGYVPFLFPALYLPFMLGSSLALRANTTPLAYWPGSAGMLLFLMACANFAQAVLLSRSPDENTSAREKVRKALAWVGWGLFGVAAFVVYQLLEGEGIQGMRGLLRVINSGLASLLLFPIAWASDLFRVAFEGWTVAAGGKLLGLGALAAVSFALLFARDRDFYEGAVAVSARRLRITQAVRRGDSGAILSQMAAEGKLGRGRSVRAFGGGALAVVWKDVIANTRTPLSSWVTLLVIAAFPALLGRALGGSGSDAAVLFWAAIFTLQMSGVFLLPLRDMLRRADIMKALPVPPARLLLGEQVLSIALLTLLGWISLALMLALGIGRGPLVLVAFLSLPSLAALMLLVQTCFVLLYPNQEDAAQKGLAGVLSLAACTLALLPPAVVGAALFFADVGPAPLALGVCLTNLVAAGVALSFATLLWQRFDPTD